MYLSSLASNIKRLRNDKRFSQSQLAELTGLSISTIKKLETATTQPKYTTVKAISDALGVRVTDLFSSARPLQSVRFRSRKRIRIRESILADVARWLDDFNFLDETLSEKAPYILRELRLSHGPNGGPINMAMECRNRLGLDEMEPICGIGDLLEESGIKIYFTQRASERFFGLCVGEASGGPAIVVNAWVRITPERRIFTAAHELAHLLLHLEAFDVSREDEDEDQEREADVFAGHFLMPQPGFDREWQNAAGLHWVDRVLKVKRLFRVSYKTVLKRLVELNKTDDSIWRAFNNAYRKRFGQKLAFKDEPRSMGPEPKSLESLDFTDDRLSGLVRKALERDLISMSRGAEILRIGASEMQALSREWETMP